GPHPLRRQCRRPRRPARPGVGARAAPRRGDRGVDRPRLARRAPGLPGHLRRLHELPRPGRVRPLMRLPEGLVGTTVGPLVQEIDARWLMAYAAALGDVHAPYLDTTRPEGVIGHPIFPVCYEWPLAVELRASALSESIAVRSVHATHDLRLRRRARAGDRLSTTATVISSEPRAPGAFVVTRLETVDAAGRSVSTTDYGSIYRGVECERARLPSRVAGLADSTGDACFESYADRR